MLWGHTVRRLSLGALGAVSLWVDGIGPAGDPGKLDAVLRQAVARGTAEELRVIIQAAPRAHASLRSRLAAHGGREPRVEDNIVWGEHLSGLSGSASSVNYLITDDWTSR
jgi:hypothetical protein